MRYTYTDGQPKVALIGDLLYGVAGALATLTVVIAVLAAVTSRTTKPRSAPEMHTSWRTAEGRR
ncbi:hypothetical protein [Nonomuraea sp. NPDC049141]|uniref:hypothetical protein n=1 Tax=Nonomuraea sp. NPDC049141 TaxID=3155500 RepID=UPI0033DD5538